MGNILLCHILNIYFKFDLLQKKRTHKSCSWILTIKRYIYKKPKVYSKKKAVNLNVKMCFIFLYHIYIYFLSKN